jgi:type IV pilus assembly protein PilC
MMQAIYRGMPVIGRLYHRGILSRLTDAMALLVGAGCDLPTTVRLAAGTTGSHAIVDECESVAAAVERGEGLFQAGQQCRIVPPLVFYSMQLGSQRGELQDNLYSLAEMYGQQVRASQARLQAILLPLMLISVGLLIGLIVIALFLPMMGVMQGIWGQ